MKTAATKSNPVSLGTKRTCPKCSLKFYDFSKPTIQCPKCATEVDPNAQPPILRQASEGKKAAKVKPIIDEEEATTGASDFESVDDLGDDDDSLDELAATEVADDEDA